MYTYTYINIQRERERQRERDKERGIKGEKETERRIKRARLADGESELHPTRFDQSNKYRSC